VERCILFERTGRSFSSEYLADPRRQFVHDKQLNVSMGGTLDVAYPAGFYVVSIVGSDTKRGMYDGSLAEFVRLEISISTE